MATTAPPLQRAVDEVMTPHEAAELIGRLGGAANPYSYARFIVEEPEREVPPFARRAFELHDPAAGRMPSPYYVQELERALRVLRLDPAAYRARR